MKRKFLSARETARSLGKTLPQTLAHFEEAEQSHDEIESALRNHLRTTRGDGSYRWLRAVYDSFLVWEESGDDGAERLYRADYSMNDAGAITLGAAGEVRMEVKFVPVAQAVSESAKTTREIRLGSMREAKIGPDGMVLVKIIDAGVGSCGLYRAEILQAACEANKFPAGLQMFANHQTNEERSKRPEGEIEKIVAVTRENGYWDENGPDGPAVYARAQITQHWRATMESLADDIGTSWDGSCAYSWGEVGGKEMPIVEEILNVKSVDFVTRAGRGGKIMSLQEAAREHDFSETKAENEKAEPDKSPAEQNQSGGDTEMNEAEIKAAKEAAKAEGQSEGHKAGMVQGVETFKAAQKIAREAVSGLALPESVKELLINSQTNDLGALPMKENALDSEALKTRVKDAAEAEALRARESYGWGGGSVQHQSGDKTASAREASKFAEVDAALAGYVG